MKKEQVRGMIRDKKRKKFCRGKEYGGWVWFSKICPLLGGLEAEFWWVMCVEKGEKAVPQQHESSNQRPSIKKEAATCD